MAFYTARNTSRLDRGSRRVEMSPERSPLRISVKVERGLDREYGYGNSGRWSKSPIRESDSHKRNDNRVRRPPSRERDRERRSDFRRPSPAGGHDRRMSPVRNRNDDNNGRGNRFNNRDRSRSPRRGNRDDEDNTPFYRTFATKYARSEAANRPAVRPFDPAQVPRGRNYFEHDSRDDPDGEANGRSMYDPRNDNNVHEKRSNGRDDGWSYHNAGAGGSFEKSSRTRDFIPRNQLKSGDNTFFSRARQPVNIDEPWVHDKFEELIEEEEKHDKHRSSRSNRIEPEDDVLSESGNEDEQSDEEKEKAMKRRLTDNLRKREPNWD